MLAVGSLVGSTFQNHRLFPLSSQDQSCRNELTVGQTVNKLGTNPFPLPGCAPSPLPSPRPSPCGAGGRASERCVGWRGWGSSPLVMDR